MLLEFEFPAVFGLLILFAVCERFCPARSQSLYFPHLFIFQKATAFKSKLLWILKWLSLFFLVAALASPIQQIPVSQDPKMGCDIVLVLDASRSMEEGFGKISKFERLKIAGRDFVTKRFGDNIGVVVFGDFALIASPLTFDKEILSGVIDHLSVGMAGEKRAIADALVLSARLLLKGEAKSKVAILFTDGKNTAGITPDDVAIDLNKRLGIKVYTVGLGEKKSFDEAFLAMVASQTGGVFFQAQNDKVLQGIYEKIDELEKSQMGTPIVHKNYLFIYPLFLSVLSLLFYVVLRNKRIEDEACLS